MQLVMLVELVTVSSSYIIFIHTVSHFDTNFYFLLFLLFKKPLFKFEGSSEWSWISLGGFDSLEKVKNHCSKSSCGHYINSQLCVLV